MLPRLQQGDALLHKLESMKKGACVCEKCIYQRQRRRGGFFLHSVSVGAKRHMHLGDNNQTAILEGHHSSEVLGSQTERPSRLASISEVSPPRLDQRYSSFDQPKQSVVNGSVYLREYEQRQKTKSPEKLHPMDQLHFKGPTSTSSTYGSQYPGPSGANPYVKPQEYSHLLPLKMNVKSTYSQSFEKSGNPQLAQLQRGQDHFRSGLPFLGISTYKQVYASGNPEVYTHSESIIYTPTRLLSTIDQESGYKSTYRSEFLSQRKSKCEGDEMLSMSTIC